MATEWDYRIGDLARLSGVKAATIRYYEDEGLMPAPARLWGGHRIYDQSHVERLTFIRRCREFGFTHAQIRQLTVLAQDDRRSCAEARDLAQAHLVEVRRKLAELHALERSLEGYVADCANGCLGGPAPDCSILTDIADEKRVVVRGARCCG